MANTIGIVGPGEVKAFCALSQLGVLSTISRSTDQYPFGSVTPFDIDEQGRPIIFVANISEHFRNLTADSRASLCVLDSFGLADAQAYARVTLLGDFRAIPEAEGETVAARYWKRFPDAVDRSIAHTFQYFRCELRRIRWIGGFGDIRWIDVDGYQQSAFDPVAYEGLPAVDHMNADHRAALVDFVESATSHRPELDEVQMVALASAGFVIRARSARSREEKSQSRDIFFPFPEPPQTSAEVRTKLIAMLKDVRQALQQH